VAAVTGGLVLRTSPIEVVFTEAQDLSLPLPESVFRLKPRAPGILSWRNEFTLVFTPGAPLRPGKRYRAEVDLSPARAGAGSGITPPFSFSFETQVPVIEVSFDPVRINEEGEALIGGVLSAEAGADYRRIERVVGSPELGRPQWTHDKDEHRFSFRPLARGAVSRTVAVTWSGRPLGAKETGFTTFRVPEAGAFEVMDIRKIDGGVLEVSFSSPLKADQDLRGFISLGGGTDLRYSLDGNVVRIFPSGAPLPGDGLFIQDLSDAAGKTLAQPVQYTVSGNWELPEVRFTGTGTILPTSQGAAMAVETRNLSGILVEAFQIYGDNMIQFLQVNGLSGTRELERVGEPVWTRSFDLPWTAQDKNRWVRRGLDLSELARKYPDGMFHLRLSFRPRHVQYECAAAHGDFSGLPFPGDSFPFIGAAGGEESFWDYAENNNRNRYDWYRYRQDPCHPAFYEAYGDHDITVGRNILVSDLGLLAKKSLDGLWLVAANNVRTAQPEADTDIDILNYQGRVLARAKTDRNGMAAFRDPGASAFICARNGLGRAYLRINDASSLAVSHFDVSGDKPISGIKGHIYGERGVWRPGDDIYLTFLLSDPANSLPPDHPVLFELEDPRGRIAENLTFTSSTDGFYPITVSTGEKALTGDWTARVRVGGNTFTKNLKVETVMPNRLKMDLDFGNREYLSAAPIPVSLGAAWLHGAPAPGLKAEVSVSFGDKETRFPSYTDYAFRDPSRAVSGERYTVYEGNLDEEGKAGFSMELNPGAAAPGKLNARFLTRVFEPGGVFSSEQIAMDFSPYRRYVGIKLPRGDASRNMLLTDTDHPADIVVLDEDGRLAGEPVNLDCAIYKLAWRWWWEKGAGEGAEFSRALSRNPVSRETVRVTGGKAAWNFRVNYPDWGRYLVVVRDAAGGHSAAAVVYIDWPGWAGRAQEGGQGAAAMLALSPEKTQYTAGETISLTFPSNRDAAALVVVEKGGEILRREWIPCQDTVTRYEFTSAPSMTPNVYVHVTLLQRHLQTQNDLPLRLYGIVPVAVEDPATRLRPHISAPAVWEPESAVSFTVREASGRPMTYTAVVVDEGLLGLTRYSMPNPRNVFYTKEASFLKSWDLYSDIMGAYAGQLETLLAIGGGDDVFDDSAKETQRFKPVTRYFGPYTLKAGEARTETFTLPPYMGALRIMVVAASAGNASGGNAAGGSGPGNRNGGGGRAYGTAEQTVQVSSDLMVFGTAPRTLSPGDEAVIPVSVYSYKEGRRTVTVTFTAEGAASLIREPPGSAGVRQVIFDKPGETVVRYRIKGADMPGQVRLGASAESPGLRTVSHAAELDLRSTAIPVSRAEVRMLSANEIWTGTIKLPGLEGTNTAAAEFSRIPPLNLESRLDYLVTYPHGCVEQTTSSVFPQLYLDRVLQLDEKRLGDLRANISAGIERLKGFQTSDGGFSYWPGEGSAHDWGSNYAGHFLIEARRAGYAVPSPLIDQWIGFQKGRAAGWSNRNSPSQTDQAYRLYTLALAGSEDLGSMNRLREQRDLNPAAAWRLAAAYWYAGQRDTARSMIKRLDTEVTDYRELSGTFGSSLRDKAMILETMTLLGDSGRIRPVYEEVTAALSAEGWLSTQETAYALISILPYVRDVSGGGQITVESSLGSRNASVEFATAAARLDLGNPAGTEAAFTVRNRSASVLYARIVTRGFPGEGEETPLSQGLSLEAEYRSPGGGIVDPDSLRPGDDMEIRLTVKNTYPREVPEIALVHLLPAAWEIINYRLAEGSSSSYKYQDIRDDRVMTYFDLPRGGQKTVILRVSRAYEGDFFRPAIHAYAMYDESVRALIPGVKARR
jgi:uncharacterized protein YfaS (alpha-2-macroglobulin family)